MRFALTDDQLAFRDVTRDLLADECPPEVVRAAWPPQPVDGRPGQGAGAGARADQTRLEQLWASITQLGIPGLLVTEHAGGLGLDEIAAVVVCEETGYTAVPFGVVEILAVAAPALAAAGNDHAELLAAVLAGTERPAVAAVDAPALPWIDAATHHLLTLRDDTAQLTTVEPATLTPLASVDGARHLARRPPHHTTRPEDELTGFNIAQATSRAALCTAAQLLGLTRRLLDMTVAYVTDRRQYGVPVGSFQALKHQLADVRLHLEFTRPVVLNAAWELATSQPTAQRSVSTAKALASDTARFATRRALQCHGAIGHTVENDLHLYAKRAWTLANTWGSATTHRAQLATHLDL